MNSLVACSPVWLLQIRVDVKNLVKVAQKVLVGNSLGSGIRVRLVELGFEAGPPNGQTRVGAIHLWPDNANVMNVAS